MKKKIVRKPKPRVSLARKIGTTENHGHKLDLALGMAAQAGFADDSNAQLQRIVETWRDHAASRECAGTWQNYLPPSVKFQKPTVERSEVLSDFADVGYRAAKAIMAGDWQFFERMAALVRYNIRPKQTEQSDLYAAILEGCRKGHCGTKEYPGDWKSLIAYLEKRGFHFERSYEYEVPSSLRRTVKKLGLHFGNAQTAKRPHKP